jgi:hypothetical protein
MARAIVQWDFQGRNTDEISIPAKTLVVVSILQFMEVLNMEDLARVWI